MERREKESHIQETDRCLLDRHNHLNTTSNNMRVLILLTLMFQTSMLAAEKVSVTFLRRAQSSINGKSGKIGEAPNVIDFLINYQATLFRIIEEGEGAKGIPVKEAGVIEAVIDAEKKIKNGESPSSLFEQFGWKHIPSPVKGKLINGSHGYYFLDDNKKRYRVVIGKNNGSMRSIIRGKKEAEITVKKGICSPDLRSGALSFVYAGFDYVLILE